jgi:hypothetical protein
MIKYRFCSGFVTAARDNIRYWCNFTHNRRKRVFTFGGDGDFENNNYIQPDLVMLRYEEVDVRKRNDDKWIETGSHFGCNDDNETIGLIKRLTEGGNQLPDNYLIEVCIYVYHFTNVYRGMLGQENHNCYIIFHGFGRKRKRNY